MGRVERGSQLEDEQALGQQVHGVSLRVGGGDESESALQVADEGAERRKLVASRTKRRVEALHIAFLDGGEGSKVLGEEREEGEWTCFNVGDVLEKFQHIIPKKRNEMSREFITEGAV